MQIDEQIQKLQRQINRLQAEKGHLEAELVRQGEKLQEKIELLKHSIPKAEHEKKIDELRYEYEQKLSEINRQLSKHTERKAGRKRIASKEITARVLELNGQGLSQGKIAAKLSDELNIKIGRTTVGEIVRGKYTSTGGQ